MTGLTLVGAGVGALAVDGAWGDFFRGAAIGGASLGLATGAAELAAKIAVKPKTKEAKPEKRNANFDEEEARRILKQARDLAERTERTDDGERRQAGKLIPMPPHLARNFGGGRLYMRAL